jgi:hypothetical protein
MQAEPVVYTEADDVFAAYDQRLPHGCYTEDKDGKLWVIIAGSKDLYEVDTSVATLMRVKSAAELNAGLNVTPAQANAMRSGVTKGWDHKTATVQFWDSQVSKSTTRRVQHQVFGEDLDD